MMSLAEILEEVERETDIEELNKSLNMIRSVKNKVTGVNLWKLGFVEDAILERKEKIYNDINEYVNEVIFI